MFKGTKILILFLLFSWAKGMSQELSHSVLVPAAGIVSTSNLEYTQTVGETAIALINGASNVFTQGFQQPAIKITTDERNIISGINVYPNPAIDYVNVKLSGIVPRKFKIEVISMAGTIVSSGTISFNEAYSYIQQVEMGSLKNGFYLVRVMSEDGVINRVFKIEKM